MTSDALTIVRGEIDQDAYSLDGTTHYRLQKLANTAQKSFVEWTLLLDVNQLLFKQNNESNCRKSAKSVKVGEAKMMSYTEIVKAQAKRDAREAAVQNRCETQRFFNGASKGEENMENRGGGCRRRN